jgi:hypothetical protein
MPTQSGTPQAAISSEPLSPAHGKPVGSATFFAPKPRAAKSFSKVSTKWRGSRSGKCDIMGYFVIFPTPNDLNHPRQGTGPCRGIFGADRYSNLAMPHTPPQGSGASWGILGHFCPQPSAGDWRVNGNLLRLGRELLLAFSQVATKWRGSLEPYRFAGGESKPASAIGGQTFWSSLRPHAAGSFSQVATKWRGDS